MQNFMSTECHFVAHGVYVCGNLVLPRTRVDELATEPFLLLHREHGTGYRRS